MIARPAPLSAPATLSAPALLPCALLLSCTLIGCGQETDLNKIHSLPPGGTGAISGRVCDEARGQWLEGASVYTHLVSDEGELLATRETQTDDRGNFLLENLAEGRYTVYVQYGSALLDTIDGIEVFDEEIALEPPECSSDLVLEIAVVTGDYDDYAEVLSAVGVSASTVINGRQGQELAEFLRSDLSSYDAILFPGGAIEEDAFYDLDGSAPDSLAAIHDNISRYVRQGGRLYLSDWSYDLIEALWPDAAEFYGADRTPNAAEVGAVDTVTATIEDSTLEDAVGSATIRILYDMETWPVAESVGPDTEILLSGPAPVREGLALSEVADAPLALRFAAGDGSVTWTSWRQQSNLENDGRRLCRWLFDDLISAAEQAE